MPDSAHQRTSLPLQITQQIPLSQTVVSVQVTRKYEIPPVSEMEIMAGVEDHQDELGTWLLQEATRENPSVAVARALV